MTRKTFDSLMRTLAQGVVNIEAGQPILRDGALADALNKLCAAVVAGEIAPTSVLAEIRAAKEAAAVEPPPEDFYRWRIELTFDVHKVWVADGFDATDRYTGRAAEHFGQEQLPYATGDEVRCSGRVLEAPPDEKIAEEQGYPNVEAWRATPGREHRGR